MELHGVQESSRLTAAASRLREQTRNDDTCKVFRTFGLVRRRYQRNKWSRGVVLVAQQIQSHNLGLATCWGLLIWPSSAVNAGGYRVARDLLCSMTSPPDRVPLETRACARDEREPCNGPRCQAETSPKLSLVNVHAHAADAIDSGSNIHVLLNRSDK